MSTATLKLAVFESARQNRSRVAMISCYSGVVYVWIFYGQSGAGKSFVGRVCAEELGCEHYDGDRDLTLEMLDALREQRPFSEKMRREFTTALSHRIRERLLELTLQGEPKPGLALSQGLFKARDRERLHLDFPNAQLVWVRAPETLIEARLQRRTGHVASNAYARLVNGGFEPSAPGAEVLENDGDRSRIVEQLSALRRRTLAIPHPL